MTLTDTSSGNTDEAATERIRGTTFADFTGELNASFTQGDAYNNLSDCLDEVSRIANLKMSILDELRIYSLVPFQPDTPSDLLRRMRFAKNSIIDISRLGPEDKRLALNGESLHDDEIDRFKWHLANLPHVFQDRAPTILQSFKDDCAEISQAAEQMYMSPCSNPHASQPEADVDEDRVTSTEEREADILGDNGLSLIRDELEKINLHLSCLDEIFGGHTEAIRASFADDYCLKMFSGQASTQA